MRYMYVTGSLILSLAAGLAVLKVNSAFGQQPANRIVPAPPGALPPPAVVQQIHAPDEQSEEAARLNALDAQLGQEAESLVKQLAETTEDKQRDEVKEKLHEALSKQFDTQQKVRELEVSRIEAKVKKLRDVISKRNNARRTIIEKRLDQLVREADGLGWNSPTTHSPGYGAVYVPQANSYYAPSLNNKPAPIYTGPQAR